MARKSVLVVGGGAAGHEIAYRLRDEANVTLVDPKTYWEVPMAVPRLLVDPTALDARIRFADFISPGQHLQGQVERLEEGTATIQMADGGEHSVSFDYAVIATGSSYLDPMIKAEAPTEAARADELDGFNRRLRQARSVVVVGGGPVGVETAAELRESFPKTIVTLIHNGGSLLENGPDRFPAWAMRYLKARGVRLILNDKVTDPGIGKQPTEGVVRTERGQLIPAGAVVWAAGARPRTELVRASWPDAVQDDGLIKVDRFLRVVGHNRVFAVGDVVNTPENRLALVGGFHAKSVAANIKELVGASNPATVALTPYKPLIPGRGFGRMMIVSLGRRDGLTSLPFGQFRSPFIARNIKSRDMLVATSRKGVGLPATADAARSRHY